MVGPTSGQLGVGIPFGCQIGAKGAQCAFDTRKAVSTWDGNSAFNTEPIDDQRPCCGAVSGWDGVQPV
jgi:hypothetical protein